MEPSDFQYIKNKKGILYDGFKYHKKTIYKQGSVLWRCRFWKSNYCSGTITIYEDKIIKHHKHSDVCNPDHAHTEILLAMDKCRENVISSENQPIPSIYKNFACSVKNKGLNLVTRLPPYESVKSSLYKHRNSKLGVNKTSFDRACEVEIPHSFLDFLLADYSFGDTRIIVLYLKETREVIPTIQHVFADGTFKSTPAPFLQIYSIHGDLGSTLTTISRVVPVMYALMTDRKYESYNALFKIIKSQVPDFHPTLFTLDFELPAIKAVIENFPDANINGCLYHFQNSIRKKSKAFGLLKTKLNRRVVDLCAVLPYLPSTMLEEGWSYVNEIMRSDVTYTKLRNYMERYWFKNKYIKDIWTVFGERHRTNNCVESWHSSLNKAVGRKKPKLVYLLNKLKDEANYSSILTINESCNKRTKAQIKYDAFIQNCGMELINGEISVAHYLEKLNKSRVPCSNPMSTKK